MRCRFLGWLGVLWVLPISFLAFVLALLLRPKWLGGGVRWARVAYGDTVALAVWGGALDGLLKRMPLGVVDGVTLGHVVLFRQSWNMRTIGAHEFAHVRQYMRWGFLFPLAYGLESVWQWLRGRHYYWDNRFEVEAYRLGREPFTRVAKKSLSSRRNDA